MEFAVAVVLVVTVSYFIFSPSGERAEVSSKLLAEEALKKKLESLEDDVELTAEEREALEQDLANSTAQEIAKWD